MIVLMQVAQEPGKPHLKRIVIDVPGVNIVIFIVIVSRNGASCDVAAKRTTSRSRHPSNAMPHTRRPRLQSGRVWELCSNTHSLHSRVAAHHRLLGHLASPHRAILAAEAHAQKSSRTLTRGQATTVAHLQLNAVLCGRTST
jgi:hypothetical protein